MEQYHSECVMHVKDRRTRMLLLVLGHADTEHVVPAPCMALLQRPGRGGGGGAAGADSIAECERWACDTLGRCCSPHKPSPEPTLPPTSINAAVSPSAGRPMGCRGSSAAAQQQKFSSPGWLECLGGPPRDNLHTNCTIFIFTTSSAPHHLAPWP